MITKSRGLISMNEKAWVTNHTGTLETLQTQFGKYFLSIQSVPDTLCSIIGTNQQHQWSTIS